MKLVESCTVDIVEQDKKAAVILEDVAGCGVVVIFGVLRVCGGIVDWPVDVAMVRVTVQGGVVVLDYFSDFPFVPAFGHLEELFDVVPLNPDRIEVFARLDSIVDETVYGDDVIDGFRVRLYYGDALGGQVGEYSGINVVGHLVKVGECVVSQTGIDGPIVTYEGVAYETKGTDYLCFWFGFEKLVNGGFEFSLEHFFSDADQVGCD